MNKNAREGGGDSEVVDRGSEPGRRVVGRIQRAYATYPGWLYNVSDGVQRRSVGVRNRVDASLDVSRGAIQRIRRPRELLRRVPPAVLSSQALVAIVAQPSN